MAASAAFERRLVVFNCFDIVFIILRPLPLWCTGNESDDKVFANIKRWNEKAQKKNYQAVVVLAFSQEYSHRCRLWSPLNGGVLLPTRVVNLIQGQWLALVRGLPTSESWHRRGNSSRDGAHRRQINFCRFQSSGIRGLKKLDRIVSRLNADSYFPISSNWGLSPLKPSPELNLECRWSFS